MQLSKSQFDAEVLEWMRMVERTGESIVITQDGMPTLELRPYGKSGTKDPLTRLKGSVLSFEDALSPIDGGNWGSLK